MCSSTAPVGPFLSVTTNQHNDRFLNLVCTIEQIKLVYDLFYVFVSGVHDAPAEKRPRHVRVNAVVQNPKLPAPLVVDVPEGDRNVLERSPKLTLQRDLRNVQRVESARQQYTN